MPGIGSQACPKPVKGLHAFTRRKNAQKRLEDAYEVVNRRDENKSRVTGIHLQPSSPDSRVRREHHHLKGRNVRPDWREDPARIILVSKFEHDLLTSGALEHEGDDATKRVVFFWNRAKVKVGDEPFRIKSKRRSQNR
jgi:hypothetical protein